MGDTDLTSEAVIIQIRERLKKDDIKLWVEPYLPDSGGNISSAMKKLVNKLSNDLKINMEKCQEGLISLQKSSLENLRNRQCFNETGLATIKVKIPMRHTILNKQIRLDQKTESILEILDDEYDIPPHRWRLICAGKFLKCGLSLLEQDVKHGTNVLALEIGEKQYDDDWLQTREKIKDDLKILSGCEDLQTDIYLKVEDQKGNNIDLPAEDRESLLCGMILHDKGRVAIKNNNFNLALILLLEADKEFNQIRTDFLKYPDNHAVLNLDIVWCYLNLKSVVCLPDAQKRLELCERRFFRSYGMHFQRVIAIQGTSGNEAVLITRLHLLKGILKFYENDLKKARELLLRTQVELERLKVKDDNIVLLAQIGFTEAEARLGLRACNGSIEAAIDYILTKRKERVAARKEDDEKRQKQRRQRRYGKCKNGDFVDITVVDSLQQVGYGEHNIIKALRETNNDFNRAVNLLEGVENFNLNGGEFYQNLLKIIEHGYPAWMARMALKKYETPILALFNLEANGGADLEKPVEEDAIQDSANQSLPQGANDTEIEQAFLRISEGLTNDVDEYLDMTLEQEEKFLLEYLNLLNNLEKSSE